MTASATTDRLTLGRMQNPVRGLMNAAAALASLVGTLCLWSRGASFSRQLPLLIFGGSLLGLYTVSALYHSVPWRAVWKGRMQRLDHSMIYVVVAGTYTPVVGLMLSGWRRSGILAVVWGIAAVGIAQKVLLPQIGGGLSIVLQMVQGWIGPFVAHPLAQTMPGEALVLMAFGGLLYTAGLIMFVTQRPRLWPRVFSYHEVFHVFVVAASIVHYATIFTFVAAA
ncbi:MAG TPA: hemolysin III family protein [Candidatus Binatia bacterium]|jgi:hemolysin III